MESKIVMVGTGHVYRIAESVSFIVKNIWPQALLVELDDKRYRAIFEPTPVMDPRDMPKTYARSAKYQEKISSKNDTQTGGELVAAVQTAKLVGSDIVCIDRDAMEVMREMEQEQSLGEKMRYGWSTRMDSIFGRRKVRGREDMDEEEFLAAMRKKYPVFIRKLIDERNGYMAERIREASKKYNSMVIVVGDAHVEGLCKELSELDIYKVRLADLLDEERCRKVKNDIWNDRMDNNES